MILVLAFIRVRNGDKAGPENHLSVSRPPSSLRDAPQNPLDAGLGGWEVSIMATRSILV